MCLACYAITVNRSMIIKRSAGKRLYICTHIYIALHQIIILLGIIDPSKVNIARSDCTWRLMLTHLWAAFFLVLVPFAFVSHFLGIAPCVWPDSPDSTETLDYVWYRFHFTTALRDLSYTYLALSKIYDKHHHINPAYDLRSIKDIL